MTFIDASAPIAAHAAIKQNVHGVGANDIADVADISTHAAIKQNVHGVGANDIADVADISTHAAITTNVHGTGAGNVIVGNDELSGFTKGNGGTYVGNDSVNRAIPHGISGTPKFVLLRISTRGGSLLILKAGNIAFEEGTTVSDHAVTAMDSTNFYVGNAGSYDYSANKNGVTYTWVGYT